MYCARERRSPWNPEDGPGFPGARVTGSYELPQVRAENQIHILWRSNTVCFRAELSLQPKKVTLKQLCGTRCPVRKGEWVLWGEGAQVFSSTPTLSPSLEMTGWKTQAVRVLTGRLAWSRESAEASWCPWLKWTALWALVKCCLYQV